MASVGQQSPESFADLQAIINVINRLTVPPVKATLKGISESALIPGHLSLHGLKKILTQRLIDYFVYLRDRNMGDAYREARRILEQNYGSTIVASGPSSAGSSWRYTPRDGHPPHNGVGGTSGYNPYATHQAPKSSPFVGHTPAYGQHGAHTSSSMPPPAHDVLQSPRNPNFRSSPFLKLMEWVTSPIIAAEAPGKQSRGQTSLKFLLNPAHLELLRKPTAIHQIRLFCTTKTHYEVSYNPNHPAPVEFPITCEAKVNNTPLTVNLKGKKSAAKVLPPNLHKDRALYFGGQVNRVDLVYQETNQKYVLRVGICEVRHADILASRIRQEKFRTKEEVLGAIKRAAEDDDIETGDSSMGLKCPLSYMRLKTPIRSTVCVHMQCFDALSFYSVNEQTPSWQCPFCFKSIHPDSLFLDGYVQDILDKVPEEEETVLVNSEGRWHTPNNKYSSHKADGPVNEECGQKEILASMQASMKRSSSPNTPELKSNRGSAAPNNLSSTPQARSAKTPVEVFEIDDEDSCSSQPDEAPPALASEPSFSEIHTSQDLAPKQPEAHYALPNALSAEPKPVVVPQEQSITPQAANPPTNAGSAPRHGLHAFLEPIPRQSNSKPATSGLSTGDQRPAEELVPRIPTPQGPQRPAPLAAAEVIDLTSDSDDETPVLPPTTSWSSSIAEGNRMSQSVLMNRPFQGYGPPSAVSSSSSASVRRPSASLPSRGVSDLPAQATAPNGINQVNGHAQIKTSQYKNSTGSTLVHTRQPDDLMQAPARRMNSTSEDEETEDDSQPVRRSRKRHRPLSMEEDEDEEEFLALSQGRGANHIGTARRRSRSDDSEFLEEERAGLAAD